MNIQHKQEDLRLLAVKEIDALSINYETEFANIFKLAKVIFNTPVVLISLLDDEKQWFKLKEGIEIDSVLKDMSFCNETILSDTILEIEDTLLDNRFKANPFVTNAPYIRFYAGIAITNNNGYRVGTLCVQDFVPKKLTDTQKLAFTVLSQQITVQFNLLNSNSKLTEANARIHNINHQLTNIYSQSPIASVLIDSKSHKIINANAVFFNLLKIKSTIVGKKLVHLSAIDSTDLAKVFEKYNREGIVYNEPISCYVNDTKTDCLVSIQLIELEQRKQLRLYFLDISDLKQLELELQKAQLLAEQTLKSKSAFLYNMSHEVRTPLNAVIGFTDLLTQTDLTEKQHEYLNLIRFSGNNLLNIVNDVLDYSKIEAGMLRLENVRFNIKELIQSIHHTYNINAQEKNISFQFEISENIPDFIVGDPTRVFQILSNILGNALKFTEKGEIILLCYLVEKTAHFAQIEFLITDTGIGIPDNQLETIFDEFSQANTNTASKYGGTGLGLAIVKKLVALQNGQISITSELNKGTRCKISIPFNLKEKAIELISHKKNVPTSSILEGKKILLVEDNIINQKLVSILLGQEKMIVDIADNGLTALEKVRTMTYDVILMDIQLPELDGISATISIRKELNINTPIVAMTANSLPGEKKVCAKAGMNDYLVKPFLKDDLFNIIIPLLNEQYQTTYQFIDISYLETFSNNNKLFMSEIIETCIVQTTQDLTLFSESVAKKEYQALKKISHKMRSSLGFIGVSTSVLNKMVQFEEGSSKNTTKKQANELIKNLEAVLGELKIIFNSYKN